jgi:hypothetical protein
MDNINTCAICNQTLETSETCVLPCSHPYHKVCIDVVQRWFQSPCVHCTNDKVQNHHEDSTDDEYYDSDVSEEVYDSFYGDNWDDDMGDNEGQAYDSFY